MIRRIFCLFCMVLLLISAVPAVSETAVESGSYDFDLSFYLNADSFPELLHTRAVGYASLVNRLGLRGTFSWSSSAQSIDLEATLYFTDNPSLTYPFRLYGTKSRIFITSPLINNEIILLNMAALMEFAIKAKNTLGVPLTYFALLLPYTTESAFDGLISSWQDVIGTFTESGEVTVGQFMELSEQWTNELLNSGLLHWWITGVAAGADSQECVEVEMNNLPGYYENVTGNQPLAVSVASGSEIWTNASGDTLFSRTETEDSVSVSLSLPASGNGYVPRFSFSRQYRDETVSFDVSASICRDVSAVAENIFPEEADAQDDTYDEYEYGEDEYAEYDDYEEEYEDSEDWDLSPEDLPEILIDFHADGAGLPRVYPCDASLKMSLAVHGALYPDYAFILKGETKKDGSVILSLTKPSDGPSSPVEILRCAGTMLPAADPKAVPDYMQASLEGVYNVFSFNEQKLAAFKSKVLPPLVRSIFSFVAAAPTSACQSFLDDLTDIGILDMLID